MPFNQKAPMTGVYSVAEQIRKDREAEMRKHAEQLKRETHAKLGDELMMRFGYVPFIIAETAWDFADSVRDYCAMLRLPDREVRRGSDLLRKLRLEYEQWLISRHFTDYQRKEQAENMVELQEVLKDEFGAMHKMVFELQPHSDVYELTLVRAAAVECRLVLDALEIYTRCMADTVREKTSIYPGPVLPDTIGSLKQCMELLCIALGSIPLPDEQRQSTAQQIASRLLGAELTLCQLDGRPVEKIQRTDREGLTNPDSLLTFSFTLEKEIVKPVPRKKPQLAKDEKKQKLCEVCGEPFTPYRPNHKYCTRECARKAKYARKWR